MKKVLAKCYIWLLLAMLYAPLLFIAVFSFTESRVMGSWAGFSLKLYQNLFSGNVSGGTALLSAVGDSVSSFVEYMK